MTQISTTVESEERVMISIDPDTGVVTLINTFNVDPSNLDEAMDILMKAGEAIASAPGFVSAALHRSEDRTRIVNYAQWRSPEELRAAVTAPAFQELTEPLLSLAPPDAHTYDVIKTFHANRDDRGERYRATYARMMDLATSGATDTLPEVLDPLAYHEECVGQTPGWVDFSGAVASLEKFLANAPGLTVEILDTQLDLEHDRLLGLAEGSIGEQRFRSVDVVDFGVDRRIIRRWQYPL